MDICIYFVHLYFAFVFSSRKHRENVFIWCIYYLPHAFGIGTDASPRSIAFGNTECNVPRGTFAFISYICILHLYLLPVNTGRMYLFGVFISRVWYEYWY